MAMFLLIFVTQNIMFYTRGHFVIDMKLLFSDKVFYLLCCIVASTLEYVSIAQFSVECSLIIN